MTQTKLDASQTMIYLLDRQALLQVSGADAESFLQGQLSCDMREATQLGSRLAAHCNPKGSMHSIMRVIKFNDTFLLRCNDQNIAYTQINLNKYMMFSKADCEDLSNQWQGIGISGANLQPLLSAHFSELPTAIDQSICEGNKVIVKVPANRFELWMPADELKQLLSELEATIKLSNSDTWYKEEITQGIADIYPETREQFIPQMCNLQALNGVSFRKGCYTGQEVITRLHFRGKLTKYLTVAKVHVNEADGITRGDDILDDKGSKVATILQHTTSENWVYLQLVTNRKYADQSMFLDTKSPIITLDQPYELDPNLFIRKT